MERFTSAGLRAVLEKVAPAIAAGCVTVISVEAIRERSGDKWPRKREQVASFVERAFSRVSQPGDLMVSLNDAEFVSVQTSVSRTTSLGISAKILKEALAFFLGAAAREDLRLFQVTAFHNGALTVEPLDAGRILDNAEGAARPGARSSAPPADDLTWKVSRTWRLTSPPNLTLDLEMTPEPTWNVAARVVASFLLRPSMWLAVGDEPARPADDWDLPAVLAGEAAMNGIAYAAELIGKNKVQVALHAPLPLRAATYSTSRYDLLNLLRGLDNATRRLLILEITDLSAGFPRSRLTEVVSMVSPYCRAVLARAPSECADVRMWGGCGLSGVALDCRNLEADGRDVQRRLAIFAQRAKESSLACVGYDFLSSSLMLAAWAAGFTHLGGRALSEEITRPRSIARLQPADIFARGHRAAEFPQRSAA
ncbi:hypothetical protein [Phenylobacterium sp.]|uniref:hypothetical protein n=1 Tax=Phenylobacterium sp. TaxID=1871053 RepID=UPI001225E615|nr:hypothetical protein [Phenylobacterium sp.]THD54135.1 MAG: hypothetical protein E8A12_17670 [Phenylobacterium sp.]